MSTSVKGNTVLWNLLNFSGFELRNREAAGDSAAGFRAQGFNGERTVSVHPQGYSDDKLHSALSETFGGVL